MSKGDIVPIPNSLDARRGQLNPRLWDGADPRGISRPSWWWGMFLPWMHERSSYSVGARLRVGSRRPMLVNSVGRLLLVLYSVIRHSLDWQYGISVSGKKVCHLIRKLKRWQESNRSQENQQLERYKNWRQYKKQAVEKLTIPRNNLRNIYAVPHRYQLLPPPDKQPIVSTIYPLFDPISMASLCKRDTHVLIPRIRPVMLWKVTLTVQLQGKAHKKTLTVKNHGETAAMNVRLPVKLRICTASESSLAFTIWSRGWVGVSSIGQPPFHCIWNKIGQKW